MLTVEERYRNDAEFHALVDILYTFIVNAKYTPTELRDAILLAATKYEMNTIRPSHLFEIVK